MNLDARVWAAAAALGMGAAIAAAAPAAADGTDAPVTRAKAPAAKAVSSHHRTARSGTSPAPSVRPVALSPFSLSSRGTGAAELSGITYAGGTTYYSVGDNGAKSIWGLYTSLGSPPAGIRSGFVSSGIAAPALGRDSEGIALTPSGSSVWVADEIDSTITEFSLTDGSKVGSVAVPDIYRPANVQGNFGLESLAYGAGALWTGNEEALRSDGSLSSTTVGSWVRIQKFTGSDFTPAAQYAYRTDPISELSPFTDAERSGLVDVVALPDGRVLSLERELGGFLPVFRSRLYAIDFTDATDVSNVPSLTGGGFTAVTKTLLWQGYFALTNFEGIALGPLRSDGSYSLLLVSDDGSGILGQRQTLLTLTLDGQIIQV
ncbi:MAG: esterase-like activity of phytase family protein [Mycobacterium sp.]